MKKKETKIWSREESKERFPYPISPLGWSLLRSPTEASLEALSLQLGIKPPAFDHVVRRLHGYVYTKKNFFSTKGALTLSWRALTNLSFLIFSSALICTVILVGQKHAPWFYRIPGINWIIGFWRLRHSSYRNSGSEINNPWILLLDRVFSRRVLKASQRVLTEWSKRRTALLADLEIPLQLQGEFNELEFSRLKNDLQKASCAFFFHDFNVYFLKNLVFRWLLFRLKISGYTTDTALNHILSVTKGLQDTFSIAVALDFQKMDYPTWIRKYGHLTDNWDIMAPLLQDLPESLIRRSYESPAKTMRSATLASASNPPPTFPPRFNEALNIFRQLVIVDEEMRANSSRQFPEIKKLFALITQLPYWPKHWPSEAIYYLELHEIESALEIKNFLTHESLIHQRQAEYRTAQKVDPPLCIYEDSLRPVPYLDETNTHSSLLGCPISDGNLTAPALVIHSMIDFAHFEPGKQILVVRTATPTYAPYYTSCLGILAERGGILCHGALVARELGIPMIGEINTLFEKIRTGDILHIDGRLGTIKIHSHRKDNLSRNYGYIWQQSTLSP